MNLRHILESRRLFGCLVGYMVSNLLGCKQLCLGTDCFLKVNLIISISIRLTRPVLHVMDTLQKELKL